MKSMKKCAATNKNIINYKRRSSAGLFNTSSAGAVTSLIIVIALSILFSLVVNPTDGAFATTSTLTISVADTISLDATPGSVNGAFFHSSTSDPIISVLTNNYTGYTLGIAASNANDNALKYVENNNIVATIPSHTVSAGVSADNYANDSYASSNNLTNTWGFRPSKYNSVDNTTSNTNLYYPGPTSTNTITLDSTNQANASVANTYNIAIGTRLNNTQAIGSYSNTFVISVVANAIPYNINYSKNTTDTVSNMPANESSATYNETVQISSNVPTRSGFVFGGWCTVQTTDYDSCSDVSGTEYTLGANWIINQTTGSSGNTLTLYATWKEPTLYNTVASMNRGTQIATDLQTEITKSNSGVYTYNSSVFGTSSDASNNYPIYYYRGILDNVTGTYGSDGDNKIYPNTVVLSSASDKTGLTTDDTCWRIVRTTGSGGVKMIYQGKWTGSTCANATTNAHLGTVGFNNNSNSIVYVGYTYNNNYTSPLSSESISPDIVFGSNADPTTNNTRSTMKVFIEDTWYANNMTSYTSLLEGSAGWCNDRSYYGDTTGTASTDISPSVTINNGNEYSYSYFGSRNRNLVDDSAGPSLNCTRGDIDIYRYVPENTNYTANYLKYPTALLTADEAALAGSGRNNGNPSTYNINSFLNIGTNIKLLSPAYNLYYQSTTNYATTIVLNYEGRIGNNMLSNTNGVRPVISLKAGTKAVSGSGTAADPWIVNPKVTNNINQITVRSTTSPSSETATSG